MDKCEKEEKFEEAAVARDRILKLKKLENKRTLEDLRLKQEEEMKIIVDKFDADLLNFQTKSNENVNSIKESNEREIKELSDKHLLEKEEVVEKFNSNYPNKPKYSPEVLNLKKIMEGHIKNQEYEKANDVKIKIIKLCEEQVIKHEVEIKNNKLTSELEKLKSKQDTEMFSLKQTHGSFLNETIKKYNAQEEVMVLHSKKVIKRIENAHTLQLNEQLKINKKNLNTKITANRVINNSSIMDNSKLSKYCFFILFNYII